MVNNNFKTKFYDKRDTFPFSIVCMSHFNLCIPSNDYYASRGSENLSFVTATSDSKKKTVNIDP